MNTNLSLTLKAIEELYISWRNDFLTIERFAEHHDISQELAAHLISVGRFISQNGTGQDPDGVLDNYKTSVRELDYDKQLSDIIEEYEGSQPDPIDPLEEVSDHLLDMLSTPIEKWPPSWPNQKISVYRPVGPPDCEVGD